MAYERQESLQRLRVLYLSVAASTIGGSITSSLISAPNEDLAALEGVLASEWLPGVVRRVTDSAVDVDVAPPAGGLPLRGRAEAAKAATSERQVL